MLRFGAATARALDQSRLRELGRAQGVLASISYPHQWTDVFRQTIFADEYPAELKDHFLYAFCRELSLLSSMRLNAIRAARSAFKQTDPNGETVSRGTTQHLVMEHILTETAISDSPIPVGSGRICEMGRS
jgi:hypothetical protein